MADFKNELDGVVHSAAHLSKRHVHPKLLKMFEMGGMNAVFERAENQYLWDVEGNRYLDLLSGGGVYFAGRNNPMVHEYLKAVLDSKLPNLSIVNASLLGGMLAEKLLKLAGPHYGKVIFANTGTEATEVAIRFARYVTRRRRFLYLDKAFHGRTYAAISLCGDPHLREGQDPMMPTCTCIRPNDLKELRKELKYGDVAAVFVEPVQGMSCEVMSDEYMREVESLCEQYGTLFVADEVQTGLARTGSWFRSNAVGARPHIMTVSKTLSGGHMPVSAVLVSEEIYQKVYERFQSGPFYFSTFAENNLAMAAGIATLDFLEEMDAPAVAERLGNQLFAGLNELASRYDVIEKVVGKGLMAAVYFKDSAKPMLSAEQKMLNMADSAAFAAAVNVDMYKKHHILVQIPGVGVNAIKVLPPVTCTPEDITTFVNALDDILATYYQGRGPVRSLSEGVVGAAMKQARSLVPSQLLSGFGGDSEKKNL